MKKSLLAGLALAALSCLLPSPALRAQSAGSNNLLTGGPGTGVNGVLAIKNITVTTPLTPQFQTVNGDDQLKRFTPAKWLEVEFSASAPTREAQFKFNIEIGNTLIVGQQTVVDMPASQSLFTSMYVAPRTLTTLLRGSPLTPTSVQNIAVQILRPGVAQPIAVKQLNGNQRFYETMQQVPGFVLPKSETPFAFLYWDRYEQVRPEAAR